MARTFLCGGLLIDAVTALASLPAALELGGILVGVTAVLAALWDCGTDICLLSKVVENTTLPEKLDLAQFLASQKQ